MVEFKIDQDVFRGKPFLAAQTMIDFTLKVDSLGEDVSAQQGFDTMADALQLVLMPESYERLRARMREPQQTGDPFAETGQSFSPPIELPRVNEILEWLMGEYGMRPPTSAEGSSAGLSSQGSGTNSTESASRVVSISSDSLPTTS